MKFGLFCENGRMAIVVFILIQFTVSVYSYKCPTDMHRDCTCEERGFLGIYELACKNNYQSIKMMSYFSMDLKIICKNVSSDGDIFQLLNFERDNDVSALRLTIDSCPVSVVNKIESSIISRTTTSILDVLADGMSSLPANLFNGKSNLLSLTVKGNQLTTLPANIFDNLFRLALLQVSGGRIESFPTNIFDRLTGLVILHLSENQLKTVPENMFKRQTIVGQIDLSYNQLTTLPANIFEYNAELRVLELQGNKFETLPANIFSHLHRIQTLNLNENPWKCDCDFLKIVRTYKNSIDFHYQCPDGESINDNLRRAHASCSEHNGSVLQDNLIN